MSWATEHVAALQRGETVKFRPFGGSMKGRIDSGSLVTVEPLGERDAEVDEAVLCRVNGKVYLHLVKAKHGGHYLIGNNVGRDNGWCLRPCIYGRVVRIEP
jgi:hypothetical protein